MTVSPSVLAVREQSIGWRCFVEQHTDRGAAFQARYDAFEISTDDVAPLLALRSPVDVVAIVEDWCPDVLATLPLFARIAASTDRLRLHILIRSPQTREFVQRHVSRDGHSHIPTYVFFDDGVELGVFIERAEAVTNIINGWVDHLIAGHPTATRDNWTRELPAREVQAALSLFSARRADILAVEKAAVLETVREIVLPARTDERARLIEDLRVARSAQWCA